MTSDETFRELMRVEALLASDESKGKRTILRKYHAKLGRDYYRSLGL